MNEPVGVTARPLRPLRARMGLAGNEAALVKAVQDGSPEATEALVRVHWDGAHRAAFLIVQDAQAAEDIAQEAMLAAVRSIDQFDRGRPFGAWLHRIVANRSIDWVRARARRAEVSVAHPESEGAAPPTAGDALSPRLTAALMSVEPEQRAAVVLRHLLDYRSTEIARMLDIPAPTVRTGLRRSLKRVRALLDVQQGEGS